MDSAADAALYTRYVLKDGDSFLVANSYGDIAGPSEGFFVSDTRVLASYRLRLGEETPTLLSSAVTQDNVLFVAHLTNRALSPLDEVGTPQGLIHISRNRFLCQERMYERLTCVNYGEQRVTLPLRFSLSADFWDMFEVRGSKRPARGRLMEPEPGEIGYVFRYVGLDDVERASFIRFSRPPIFKGAGELEFLLSLDTDETQDFYIEVGSDTGEPPSRERYRQQAAVARRRMRTKQRRGARILSSGPLFDQWMRQSRSDLALLTSDLETGPYPYAGIPWFSTPFGRDAVITALQTLWLDPGLAKGVLRFLADHQAKEDAPFLDAAPGKIMHETRKGEMSSLRELPFGLYYGGVDTTPLFVMLAHAYYRRTGDAAFLAALWPSLEAAIGWVERVCDANPLGLLDYARAAEGGLSNQGWKDSGDSVFHADGRLAPGPIALVEVQGYAFAALQGMAALAMVLGQSDRAAGWQLRAQRLRGAVETHYWDDELGFYGLAIDGENQLCRVRTSNPGHLLYTGLAEPARATRVAEQLLSSAFFSGWGVRTVARGEARYNPISYHNGSTWPHDSALCGSGIARAGVRGGVTRLLRGAFEAAVHFDMRLPELFCGFSRRQGAPPVAYPVACLPQAWAAGSGLMLLQACLGIEVDGVQNMVEINRPELPTGIEDVRINDLLIGDRRFDLVFRKAGERISAFAEGEGASGLAVCIRQ
jgi:glycogen debranching enzyme